MNINDPQQKETSNLGFDKSYTPQSIEHMRSTVPWMKFVAIIGFIFSGLMAIGSLGIFAQSSSRYYSRLNELFIVLGFVYLIMAVAILIINIFLFRYAMNLGTFVNYGDNLSQENAFKFQKNFFLMWGICLIISIAMMIIYIALVASLARF